MRMPWLWPLMAGTLVIHGAERVFDFGATRVNETPAGFVSLLAGDGTPGEWKIVLDEVPPLLAPLTGRAAVEKRPVLAQLSRDRTDERYPMLIYSEEAFGDFTFSTRFKLVDGAVEQMAGLAFRLQDERNYYYVRASGLSGTFNFYVVRNGQRSPPIGNKIEMARGVWHELSVECRGQEIKTFLNGRPALPALQDATYGRGKIGFWTKSDSVTYFADARVLFTPLETLAEVLVREAMVRYPRLLGLQIIGPVTNVAGPVILASSEPAERGRAGGAEAADTIQRGAMFYGKTSRIATVTVPLRDSNGDIVAALRVSMKPFPGQTEKNALARATPIARSMESRIRSGADLTR